MLCAIHQPNFFPWLGYFEKIYRADVFVFLNQVDYEKSGHSMQCYTNRVSVVDRNGMARYIYCPVIREHGPQRIDAVEIKNHEWKQNIIKELNECYSKAPFKSLIDGWVNEILGFDTNFVSDFNIFAIKYLCMKLGIDTRFYCQDEIGSEKHSSELLVELVKSVGCDKYLHGKGGKSYQDPRVFENERIETVAQDYICREYYQGGGHPFVQGLSILDSLYWIGPDETMSELSDLKRSV